MSKNWSSGSVASVLAMTWLRIIRLLSLLLCSDSVRRPGKLLPIPALCSSSLLPWAFSNSLRNGSWPGVAADSETAGETKNTWCYDLYSTWNSIAWLKRNSLNNIGAKEKSLTFPDGSRWCVGWRRRARLNKQMAPPILYCTPLVIHPVALKTTQQVKEALVS